MSISTVVQVCRCGHGMEALGVLQHFGEQEAVFSCLDCGALLLVRFDDNGKIKGGQWFMSVAGAV